MKRSLNTSTKGLSKIIIVALLGFIALVVGLVVWSLIKPKPITPKGVTLTMWGVWDETSDVAEMINGYQAAHPYIKINYVKKRFEEYEDALLKGWATDTGPDIYTLPNSWVNKYRPEFITPIPASTKIAFYQTKKILFKTETTIEYLTKKALAPQDIKRDFLEVVYGDVVFDGALYALPLGVNTLVMFYNKDLLNQAHLAQPPRTWSEFTSAVSKIAIVNEQNSIIRAGAALGTYDNIPRATDLVTLLMLQNGATMIAGNKIVFNQAASTDPTYFPGEEAVRFYTDFARPEKAVYTWSKEVATSALDFFAGGNLVFFFGYRYQEADIRAQRTGIDFGIAPVPQINPTNEINVANYWVYTVAKKSKYANEAWAFLQYAADAKRAKPYAEKTEQTSALRSVVTEQLNDPDLGLFAQQALTAKSWYHGRDPQNMENSFADMIRGALENAANIKNAVTLAAQKIQQTY